jgi:hypothetical protein
MNVFGSLTQVDKRADERNPKNKIIIGFQVAMPLRAEHGFDGTHSFH